MINTVSTPTFSRIALLTRNCYIPSSTILESRPSTKAMENLPDDYFVKTMQFTARTHRDVYAAIDPSQDVLSQKGKVVVITGASQGIGARGFVPSFVAASPKAIVLVARRADKLQEIADTIKRSHPTVETLVVPTDIGDPVAVQELFEKVKEKYGHADVLVNNAAVFKEERSIRDADHQIWWEEMVCSL